MSVANLQQNHCFYKYYGIFFRFEDSPFCIPDRPSPTELQRTQSFFFCPLG